MVCDSVVAIIGKSDRTRESRKESLESGVKTNNGMMDLFKDVETELEKKKYSFRAFSVTGGYHEQVIQTLKSSFPSIYLASVSPLAHIPQIEGKYELYTFRKSRGTDMGRID